MRQEESCQWRAALDILRQMSERQIDANLPSTLVACRCTKTKLIALLIPCPCWRPEHHDGGVVEKQRDGDGRAACRPNVTPKMTE